MFYFSTQIFMALFKLIRGPNHQEQWLVHPNCINNILVYRPRYQTSNLPGKRHSP